MVVSEPDALRFLPWKREPGSWPPVIARLHVREIGEGPSIVVLHGGPDFGYDYLLPELDRLAERCRLVYYDQRGRGRSADGVRSDDVSIESEMEDLDLLRRASRAGIDGGPWAQLGWSARDGVRQPSSRAADSPDLDEHRSRLVRGCAAVPAASSPYPTGSRHRGDAGPRAERRISRGRLEVEAAYYRIHYRVALHDPGLVDRLVPRLRLNSTPEQVLTARAIEDRLYEQTWSSPGYDLLPKLRRLAVPISSSMARTTSFRSRWRHTSPRRSPGRGSRCCPAAATSRTWRHPKPSCSTSASCSR